MRFFKFKKGVSPLIATVLLIAFAVSLGAVVMNWGRGYVESTTEQVETQAAEKISCSMDTSLGIVQVGNKQKLCIDDDGSNYFLKFTLVNTGSVPLEGIQVTELWENHFVEPYNVIANPSIEKSKLFFSDANLSKEVTEDRETDLEELEQIEIAPIILVKGVKTICLEHSIKRLPGEIGDC